MRNRSICSLCSDVMCHYLHLHCDHCTAPPPNYWIFIGLAKCWKIILVKRLLSIYLFPLCVIVSPGVNLVRYGARIGEALRIDFGRRRMWHQTLARMLAHTSVRTHTRTRKALRQRGVGCREAGCSCLGRWSRCLFLIVSFVSLFLCAPL